MDEQDRRPTSSTSPQGHNQPDALDADLEKVPRNLRPPKDLIQRAAAILEPLLINREEVEQLATSAQERGPAEWSEQEREILPLIGRAWCWLAPLGVETTDLRRLFDNATRDAWNRWRGGR